MSIRYGGSLWLPGSVQDKLRCCGTAGRRASTETGPYTYVLCVIRSIVANPVGQLEHCLGDFIPLNIQYVSGANRADQKNG